MKLSTLKFYVKVLSKYLKCLGLKDSLFVENAVEYLKMLKGCEFGFNTIKTTANILQSMFKFQPKLSSLNHSIFAYSMKQRKIHKILMMNNSHIKSWLFENCDSKHKATSTLALLIFFTLLTGYNLKHLIHMKFYEIKNILLKPNKTFDSKHIQKNLLANLTPSVTFHDNIKNYEKQLIKLQSHEIRVQKPFCTFRTLRKLNREYEKN